MFNTRSAVFRVGSVLVMVVVLFILLRQWQLPRSFGQYGYYRGESVNEWAGQEPVFAGGREECRQCHGPLVTGIAAGRHQGLDCQNCHGPARQHGRSSKGGKIDRSSAKVCEWCHRQMAGRKNTTMSVVEPEMHSGGLPCLRCHDAHLPAIEPKGV